MEGEGDEEAQAVSALIHHPQDVQNGRSAKEEKKCEFVLSCWSSTVVLLIADQPQGFNLLALISLSISF